VTARKPPALAPPPVARPRTKQEFVYCSLHAEIMRCDLAPGERLVIDEVARRLQVSTIPVREALLQLQAEGLIVNTPHVGATVAPLSRESIIDVFTLLEALGHVAARLVAERGRVEELERLQAIVTEMDEAVASLHYEDWARLNTQFHLAIAVMPGLPLLRETTERVLDRWSRVRRFYFSGVLQHRMELAQREHREMLAAMRGREMEALAAVVRRHSQGALTSYLQYLDSRLREESGTLAGSSR
jgi:DNA-binding GntR family transcriptional regulator